VVVVTKVKCRFGCEHPVGIFWIPEGCVCWPDPVQALCEQHFVKVTSDGPVILIMALGEQIVHTPEGGVNERE
jgi:hypothetical protein